MTVMNQQQRSQKVFSRRQQNKFQQLQLEVAALEAQVENALKEQMILTHDYHSLSPIPLVCANDQTAQTGIRLTPDTIH